MTTKISYRKQPLRITLSLINHKNQVNFLHLGNIEITIFSWSKERNALTQEDYLIDKWLRTDVSNQLFNWIKWWNNIFSVWSTITSDFTVFSSFGIMCSSIHNIAHKTFVVIFFDNDVLFKTPAILQQTKNILDYFRLFWNVHYLTTNCRRKMQYPYKEMMILMKLYLIIHTYSYVTIYVSDLHT